MYDAVYPWEKGGAQKRVWELARRLAADHEVHLYGMHYWDGPPTIDRDGVTLHGVCRPYDLYTDGRRAIPPAIKFATALARPLLREEFDIVDCQQFPYFPVFTAKAHELTRQSALVVTWYEVWDEYWYEYLGWKGIAGQAIERATIRLPDTIVPISSFIRDRLTEIGRSTGLTVVENGVDYHRIQTISPAETEWDVVYAGRLAEHKHLDVLLDAVRIAADRLNHPIRTCIIGDGPERDRLEHHAQQTGVADHVTFKGFLDADDAVLANLKAARVFVLPSTREGFPNTILEANACGTPSIIVDHPENGSTAVVEDGETGLISTPGAYALADRLVDVLSDDALHDYLASNARDFGAAHDWEVIVDDLVEVYTNTREH